MKKFTFKTWMLLILGGIGYASLNGSAFLISSYYNLFANGLALSNTQVGTCMTMVGFVAGLGYLFGGILGDIFKTKTLMLVSHGGCALCLLYMLTLPGYGTMLILSFLLAFFAICTYWGAMSRYVKSLGDDGSEGKLYGIFYGACGLGGSLIGFVVAAVVSNAGDTQGLRLLLICYACANALAAAVIGFFYNGYKSIDNEDRFKFSDLKTVLKMPDVWLIGLAMMCLEMVYSVMAYVAPMLETDFAVSVAIITVIVAIRVHVCRLVTSPVSGIIVDKLGSPMKVIRFSLWACLAFTIVITVIPWTPAFAWFAIITVLVLAILFNLSTPCWFTTVDEVGVPARVRATAVGLVSLLTFSGDMWSYTVGGNWVDKYGSMGYRYYFIMCIGFFVAGLIFAYISKARIKKRAAES